MHTLFNIISYPLHYTAVFNGVFMQITAKLDLQFCSLFPGFQNDSELFGKI